MKLLHIPKGLKTKSNEQITISFAIGNPPNKMKSRYHFVRVRGRAKTAFHFFWLEAFKALQTPSSVIFPTQISLKQRDIASVPRKRTRALAHEG